VRLSAASDKGYQLLANGRWFTSGTPTSSTTKTGRHDVAEMLLKMVLTTKYQIIVSSDQLTNRESNDTYITDYLLVVCQR
jgi:hypothetical protein